MSTIDLEKISNKSQIKTLDILNILKIIKEFSPSISELVKKTNLSHGQIKRLVSSLNPQVVNFSKASQFLTLSKEGEDVLSKQDVDGKQDTNSKELENFISYAKGLMPPPKREYDQFYATTETIVKRIEKFMEQKDLQKRKVAFLGDDDLTSLAAAFMFSADEIVVLEIDDNIIAVIEKVARSYNLRIQCIKWDLKKAIPQEFLHKFDTVFTDPPYTEDGFDLFLRRSLEITKEGGLPAHYICYGTSSLSRERSLKIQHIINAYNLFIREKIHNFNKYIKGAEAVGNASDLYILEKTAKTKMGKSRAIKKLYTWE